jgi:uncharacterized protein YhjY with autotransporter beta-barrel domain
MQTHPKSPAKPVQQKQPKTNIPAHSKNPASFLSDKQNLQNKNLNEKISDYTNGFTTFMNL